MTTLLSRSASSGVSTPTRSATARAVAGWSPVMRTGTMPAVRQSSMVDRAAGLAGSFMATRPSRRCSAASQSAPRGTSAAVNASTRNPSPASSAARSRAARHAAACPPDPCWAWRASTEPLVTTRTRRCPRTVTRWAVVIRWVALSNGTSPTRGATRSSSSLLSPAFPAALSRASSVGSPSPDHGSPGPAGGARCASLQSTQARSSSSTSGA